PELELNGLARALAFDRAQLSHRAVALAGDREELSGLLAALEHDQPADGLIQGIAHPQGKVAFLFSGQGSQWVGMGRGLYGAFPPFAEALDAICAELDGHLDRGVKEIIFAEEGSEEALLLDRTQFTQAALFALEVALHRLISNFGLAPDYLIGHSIGELVAAHVAGVLSLRDACALVAARGRLMGSLPAAGGMVSMVASEQEAMESLAGFEEHLSLAAVNGPRAVVVSGAERALAQWELSQREQGRKLRRLRVSHAFHSQLMEPMLDELRAIAEGLHFSAPNLPIVSNTSGSPLSLNEVTAPAYWASHVRQTVRFADGVRFLQEAGVTRFLELGPDGTLGAMAHGCMVEEAGDRALFASSVRACRGERRTFMGFLAHAHAHGLDVDWRALFGGGDGRRVELPTYAFQRRRYWLEAGAGVGDLAAAGQASAEHPLLSAALRLAGDGEGWLFTGRLSLKSHPWLGDHAVLGSPLLPGTGFVELALAAGRRLGLRALEELTLREPLLVDGEGGVQVQLVVSGPGELGERSIDIYARPESRSGDELADGEWTLHAAGALGHGGDDGQGGDGPQTSELQRLADASWPPDGARELELEFLYDRLGDAGYDYGPSFRGLRRAFRVGDELYAEVALDPEQENGASGFCVHPALLDGALHAALLVALEAQGAGEAVVIPFSFSGVRLHGQGAGALRVRLAGDAGSWNVLALDGRGTPVLSIESLQLRAVDRNQLGSARRAGHEALFGFEWVELQGQSPAGGQLHVVLLGAAGESGGEGERDGDRGGEGSRALGGDARRYPNLGALVEAIEGGQPAPELVLVHAQALAAGGEGEAQALVDRSEAQAEAAPLRTPWRSDGAGEESEDGGLARRVHRLVARTLELLQEWLAAEALMGSRLVLITEGALAVAPGEAPNLTQAALVGLLRSAHSEHPDRFALLDVDGSEVALGALAGALGGDEPELALRRDVLHVPRLARMKMRADPSLLDTSALGLFDPRGTVLITGGTGGLGATLALDLARRRGARHLLLASRGGPEADGAQELQAAMEELGCDARIAACDVSREAQLGELIASIPEEHPLTVVVHAAGVLDDGVIEALDGERLARVMGPKVDAAINLHKLTAGLELTEFILFSSIAATMGNAGQGNYAAANAFLDALAHHRRAAGLPGLALAFGAWDRATGMTGALSETDRARLARLGMIPLSDEQGLELIDIARTAQEPLLLPVRLNLAALRTQAEAGMLPAFMRGLIRVPAPGTIALQGSLARRLAGEPVSEWDAIVLELVRGHVSAVLGHTSAEAIDSQRPFKESGLDSLGAVELRNGLAQATGLRLPATLIFDHPTPLAVARCIRGQVEGTRPDSTAPRRRLSHSDEPIAIVGMSCRYPGGVRSPEDLWELVAGEVDAIGEFPADRGWDLERLYDPDPDRPGTSYTRWGGFLYDAGDFDADHFSISPREALAMDPQQRLLLEGAWEVFEDAGIDPASLRGSDTGVFAGVMYHDYATRAGPMSAELEGYIGASAGGSVVSGRLAYTFGLEGPAISIDTACSSSLVAIHLASQALRLGECELALAGGVTVISTPEVFISFSRQRGLSVDGRCRSFGVGAGGTGWSEGVGLLLLERLSVARERGHEVLAVVGGSAVNQDGASNGLTAPNGPAQVRVIRQALASAGVAAGDVDVVEGHGTGTALGDPIEAQALIAAYGSGRVGGPLYLGSVKSNIGHTQAAAGVAGVIKVVQALRHGVLPRSLHVERPSELVDWGGGGVELLGAAVGWPVGERVRRAGVSSFGVSGTNAHVILEEAPAPVEATRVPGGELDGGGGPVVGVGAGDRVGGAGESIGGGRPAAGLEVRPCVAVGLGVLPFLVSASTEGALRGQAGRLRVFVGGCPELELNGLARALAFDRAQLSHRAVALAGDREELSGLLAALERDQPAGGLIRGVPRGEGKVAFVFPGQGCQWEGMALELWESSAVFAERMEACAEALARYLDFSLRDVLGGSADAPRLEQVDVVQPALFAVMVSLAALWRSFGVRPAIVVGHSQGEIAAAHVAGGLSLDDAARVVALRSRALAEELAGRGGMVSISLPAEQVEVHVERFGERISLAAVNGPSSVVVSGEPGALAELLSEYEAQGVRARKIPVDYASHSAQIEAIRDRLAEELAPIRARTGEIQFYSTAVGAVLDTAELTAEYWYTNLRRTVRFAEATRALLEDSCTAFVEVSPHPVLKVAVEETIEARGPDAGRAVTTGSLRRGEGGLERFVASLAEAHVHGVEVDWGALLGGGGAGRVKLPTYAFQRRRYWLEMGAVDRDGLTSAGRTGHESLFELGWVEPQRPSFDRAELRVATLCGDGESGGGGGGDGLRMLGVNALCYPDLGALVEAIEGGQPAPELVLVEAQALAAAGESEAQAPVAGTIHQLAGRTLELLKQWLAAEVLAGSRLVLITEGALAVALGEAPNLTQAALVGLLRSAHSE
ncbi:MAG TPA: SDR family NAD(P)-dependent oxidoreductase, partial [Solirubrobacteraceae bacterium]|nr:SDR family NAD(P)-dependent oxidoreductase [Solirubrobacteraceae bacterium]